MGQKWSKFMPGHMGAAKSLPAPGTEIGLSPDPSVPQSEASTEASSSVSIYQGGPFSVAATDVVLSSLKDNESDEEPERGKEMQATQTTSPSTSEPLSPLQAFLIGQEKFHLKKSQATPSNARNRGALKMFNRKSRAFKQPRISSRPSTTRLLLHQAPKLAAGPAKRVRIQEKSLSSSPSQFSPSQVSDDEACHLTEADEDEENASLTLLPEPEDDTKLESEKEREDLTQPLHSSAQKLLLFELDRKRKAPDGLPSLAVECSKLKTSCMKLKSRTSQEKPRSNSEEEPRKTALDLGAGEAAVGRRMRKAIASRSTLEGHIASYDVDSRLYQIRYDNGKEAEMEWLDLEPCLVGESITTSALAVVEIKGTTTRRQSLRNAPRAKKHQEEFVYTKRKVRGYRRKK